MIKGGDEVGGSLFHFIDVQSIPLSSDSSVFLPTVAVLRFECLWDGRCKEYYVDAELS